MEITTCHTAGIREPEPESPEPSSLMARFQGKRAFGKYSLQGSPRRGSDALRKATGKKLGWSFSVTALGRRPRVLIIRLDAEHA